MSDVAEHRPQQFRVSIATSDGSEHSLLVDQNTVLLGKGNRATPIVITPVAAGTVSLSLTDGRGIEAEGDRLQVTPSATTGFVMQQVPPGDNRWYLRTAEGSYLAASEPGNPVSLVAHPGPDTTFSIIPTAQ